MDFFELAGGDKMPSMGLGTWKMDNDVATSVVCSAIQMGYRHIDGAWIYLNEKGVGKGIADALSNSELKRDDLWITSKLWNNCHRPEHVLPALQGTLQDLGLEYLDLYLIHWPVVQIHGCVRPESANDLLSLEDVPITETWQALEACCEMGLCKNIGVANFSIKKLERLLGTAKIKPAVNQVESHPFLQQRSLLEFCQENRVGLTAYSPLGSGDRPDEMKRDSEPSLMQNPVFQSIAKKHDVTPAQVLLAWAINRGTIVIPKSANRDRLKLNLESAKLKLDSDDIKQIAAVDMGYRYIDGTFWAFPGGPYSLANLWDEHPGVSSSA